MNLKIRRLIYLSFFAVFIISGSALLFYLQGFRYNSEKGKIERTGAIMATAQPIGSNIVINGSVQKENTPSTVQPLQPGNYEIIIRRDSYQTWRKNLEVKPSHVTFTGPVTLWPQPTIGKLIAAEPISDFSPAPNGETVLYFVPTGLQSGLWLINISTGTTTLLSRPSSNFLKIEWAPSSRQVLIGEKRGSLMTWRRFNLEQKIWHNVNLPADLLPQSIHWGNDDSELYFATDKELYRINLSNNDVKFIWNIELNDFRVHGRLIFALAKTSSNGYTLKALNRSNLQLVPLNDVPTLSTNLSFLTNNGDWLPLFDHDRHALYLLKSPLTSTEPIRRLSEVTAVDWLPDGTKLLLANNFEVWSYDLETSNLNLLLRLSTPLVRARLYSNEPYLLYAVGHEIWALEFDTRDEQQRWLIANYNEDIQDIFLDAQGKSMLVKTTAGFYYQQLNLTTLPVGGLQAWLPSVRN